MKPECIVISCLLVFVPPSLVAADDIGEMTGSYRNLLFATDNPAGHAVQTDVNRLRLEWMSPRWESEAGSVRAHLAYDHEFSAGGLVSTPSFQAASRVPEATWLDAEQTVMRRGRMFWRHHLYRGWLRWEQDEMQMKLGRQRIAWGSGRLWNPTDRFNPVDPTALEADQKIGVDSVMGEWRYSGTGAVQAVAAPGRGEHAVSRKTALRLRDTYGETDVALLAGRMGSEQMAGLDLAANLFDGGLHAEAIRVRSSGLSGYGQLSAGYEYTLLNTFFPEGLYLLGEYFYNGSAGRVLPNRADRLNSTVKHLVGLSTGYDVTPLLRAECTAILDAVKGSSFVAPRWSYSLARNIDLVTFVYLFAGRAGSEFGARSNLYAVQLDAYF